MARILKNGKIAVKLDHDIAAIICFALKVRIDSGDLPEYLNHLLQEAIEKLENDKCSLRKSEFFAVFHNDTMKYIATPTQILIRKAVELVGTTTVNGKWPPMKIGSYAELFFWPVTKDENIEI